MWPFTRKVKEGKVYTSHGNPDVKIYVQRVGRDWVRWVKLDNFKLEGQTRVVDFFQLFK